MDTQSPDTHLFVSTSYYGLHPCKKKNLSKTRFKHEFYSYSELVFREITRVY